MIPSYSTLKIVPFDQIWASWVYCRLLLKRGKKCQKHLLLGLFWHKFENSEPKIFEFRKTIWYTLIWCQDATFVTPGVCKFRHREFGLSLGGTSPPGSATLWHSSQSYNLVCFKNCTLASCRLNKLIILRSTLNHWRNLIKNRLEFPSG